jgi:pimeloyl-ACP methyl ester carboxylesterase
MAHFILVPGLWLEASSWRHVIPTLESAGHTANPLSLPAQKQATLQDWVDAVILAIDSAPERPVLAGHSAGCGVAYAAADNRPDAVRQLVLIGGFPLPDGMPLLGESFPEQDGFVPLPELSVFGEESLAGIDDAALKAFRAQATRVPAQVLDGRLHLTHQDRHRIPTTAVCTEYSAADLQNWVEGDFPPTSEIPLFEDFRYADLSTGHWPQFSLPDELGQLLLRIEDRSAESPGHH